MEIRRPEPPKYDVSHDPESGLAQNAVVIGEECRFFSDVGAIWGRRPLFQAWPPKLGPSAHGYQSSKWPDGRPECSALLDRRGASRTASTSLPSATIKRNENNVSQNDC